jgi:hypothetical protein
MADFHTSNLEELQDYLDDADEEKGYFVEWIADGDLDADFTLLGRILWGFGNYVLIVDEANELQTPAQINPILARYIRRAPRREKGERDPIDIIQATHFPVDLHRVSFGLADDAYIFRLTRERDFIRIRAELGEEVADAVGQTKTPETNPPGRDVVHVDIVTHEYEVMTEPKDWYMRIEKEKEPNQYVT